MRFVIHPLLFLGVIIHGSSQELFAQTPSPTPKYIPPTACVVCEVKETAKEISTVYRSRQGSVVERVSTKTTEYKENLHYISYRDCQHENTNGEQVLSDIRPENSDTRVVTKRGVQSRLLSIVQDGYCSPLGPFPRSMWMTCSCYGVNTIEQNNVPPVVSPRIPLPMIEQRYTVASCTDLNYEMSVMEQSRMGVIAQAQFRSQYGVDPTDSFYRERRAVYCERK